jgi:hypothetical protein
MARIRFLDQVPIGVFATPTSVASTSGSFSGSFYGEFTGSLFGTASYALQSLSSSYALTASFALNGGGDTFRITSASYTASVGGGNIFLINSASANIFTINNAQSVIISSSANNVLQLNNSNNTTILNVSQSGILTLSTQSVELTGPAPNGGIYFTSASFYVGLS